ncbi:hypothetical protein GALMADRAFT_143286 [Galerina marginata CBS 339.88]|uniref:Uncharacterized protein n=1 Tax=Galerina marginata (strain CBS 339.88) TaxID=685588 RepID=A0A067SXS0_GALM3|nr:hypothetical protein GALMADRAFT_143286 [Galerina marginata CBS 339.88]
MEFADEATPLEIKATNPDLLQCDCRLTGLLDEYLEGARKNNVVLEDYHKDIDAFHPKHLPGLLNEENSRAAADTSSVKALSVRKIPAFKLPPGSGEAWKGNVEPIKKDKLYKAKKATPPKPSAANSSKRGKRAKSSADKRKRTGVAIREAGGDEKAASLSRLARKWEEKTKFCKTTAYSIALNGACSSTGWSGRNPSIPNRRQIKKAYGGEAIKNTVKYFFPVPCDLLRPTILLDSENYCFFYRSAQAPWLLNRSEELFFAIEKLLGPTLQSPGIKAQFKKSERGPHFPCIIGENRPYCQHPEPTRWHKQNLKAVTEFIQTPVIQAITKWICGIVQMAFPGVAARFLLSAAWHKENYGIEPSFGLFWNLCINAMFQGQRRIHCLPHADFKNVVGVCVLVIYELPGFKFNHSQRTWLVLWEAGVVIQLPPWVMVAYPSSLLYHFNIDICDFKFVTTEGNERPTPENSTPLSEGDDQGRGSLVYFNQATMYQSSETNHPTLMEAMENGHSGTTDYKGTTQNSFEKYGTMTDIRPPLPHS